MVSKKDVRKSYMRWIFDRKISYKKYNLFIMNCDTKVLRIYLLSSFESSTDIT